MTQTQELVNTEVKTPIGAYLVLKHIDLSRLRDSNLSADLDLRVASSMRDGNLIGLGSLRAVFDGVCAKMEIYDSDSLKVTLPIPKYHIFGANRGSQGFFGEIRDTVVPLDVLRGIPGELIFKIRNPPYSDSLAVFREIVMPELFHQGYTQRIPACTGDILRLAVGEESEPVLTVHSFLGLKIHRLRYNNLELFTKRDLDKLMNLGRGKK